MVDLVVHAPPTLRVGIGMLQLGHDIVVANQRRGWIPQGADVDAREIIDAFVKEYRDVKGRNG